ncbi:MAG: hypothetical protein O3A20_03480, partial [Planctomycetota bacterium]|nr:hypothetical protein [Planctomycetota bacterium]
MVLTLGVLACSQRQPEQFLAPPAVAGLAHAGLEARDRGLILLGELGCANCHAAGSEDGRIDARRGPDLAEVGSRVRVDYLPR